MHIEGSGSAQNLAGAGTEASATATDRWQRVKAGGGGEGGGSATPAMLPGLTLCAARLRTTIFPVAFFAAGLTR